MCALRRKMERDNMTCCTLLIDVKSIEFCRDRQQLQLLPRAPNNWQAAARSLMTTARQAACWPAAGRCGSGCGSLWRFD